MSGGLDSNMNPRVSGSTRVSCKIPARTHAPPLEKQAHAPERPTPALERPTHAPKRRVTTLYHVSQVRKLKAQADTYTLWFRVGLKLLFFST